MKYLRNLYLNRKVNMIVYYKIHNHNRNSNHNSNRNSNRNSNSKHSHTLNLKKIRNKKLQNLKQILNKEQLKNKETEIIFKFYFYF